MSYIKDVIKIVNNIIKYTPPPTHTYWITRMAFLRGLGFVYFIAFLVSLHQNTALLGDKGILPIRVFLNRVERQIGGNQWSRFWRLPTILWFMDRSKMVSHQHALRDDDDDDDDDDNDDGACM